MPARLTPPRVPRALRVPRVPRAIALIALLAVAAGLAPRSAHVQPAAASAPLSQSNTANTFTVDFAHSSLVYRLRHFGVSWFTGRINQPQGTFVIDHENPSSNRVHIEAEIDNMDTGNDGRDDFLVGADFFNSREFPTAEFRSDAVTKVNDTTFEAAGEFTMHGVTNPLTVKLTEYVEKTWDNFGHRAGFVCEFTVKRSEYGMDMFVSDGTLGDEVTITAYIEGAVQPEEE